MKIADNLHERFVIVIAKVVCPSGGVERLDELHIVVLQEVEHILVGNVALLGWKFMSCQRVVSTC